MLTKYWHMVSGKSEFVAGENDRFFYFGGRKYDCIIIEKQYDTLHMGYNKLCNINGNMVRGSGTKLMLKCALNMYFSLYGKKRVYFKDASHIDCNEEISLSLALLSVCLHGKTWYELYFDAKAMTEEYKSKLTTPLSNLEDRNIKEMLPISLQKYYRPELTLHDLVARIHEHHRDCSVFVPWLSNVFDRVCGYQIQSVLFSIDKNGNNKISVKAEYVELEKSFHSDAYWESKKKLSERKMNTMMSYIPQKGSPLQDAGSAMYGLDDFELEDDLPLDGGSIRYLGKSKKVFKFE